MKFIAREGGRELDVEVQRHGAGYRVRLGDRWIEADFIEVGHYVRSLRLEDGTQYPLVHHREGNTHQISLNGATTVHVDIIDPLAAKRRRREDETGGTGTVKALMPGRVVRVLVAEGDAVRKGEGLLILEAMKMENEIQAPADGTVDELFVEAGQTVEAGADLLHITD
jgi:biotin carboxyl carrier protein